MSLQERRLCPHFGECGGCQWQDIPYREQVRWKEELVSHLFAAAGIEVGHVAPLLASPAMFCYRNKMEFTVVPDPEQGLRIGLHRRGRFDEVVEIRECWLPPPRANELLRVIAQMARRYGVQAYDYQRHEGFFRNVVLRYAPMPEQWMVMLVTTSPRDAKEQEFLHELAQELQGLFPMVRTVVHVRNDTWSPVSVGELSLLSGDGILEQELGGLRFRISPFAFFQVNWVQLERFFARILELAEPQATEVAWDLYCGTGSITLLLARRMRKVYGVELVEAAIEDARVNAALNGIENVEWFVADLQRPAARALLASLPEPDLIVVDPPRAGLHWRVVQFLRERPAQRLLYVSCNPETQVRDLKQLCAVYDVEIVQPVDLFPQTRHVESIVRLRRRG